MKPTPWPAFVLCFGVSLFALNPSTSAGSGANVTTIDFSSATPLGTWTGFYRGTQLQGNGLKDRISLRPVPAYLFQGSFPYQPRPYPEEVLFADRVSFVRFVGGWNKALLWGEDKGTDNGDLAYRNPDGSLGFRWEKVPPRIDPYLQAGYNAPIISLDNVPWQLAAYSSSGVWGQSAPVASLSEWDTFIRRFFTQLRNHYGLSLVRDWMFRMGTEPNGDAGFAGTHEDFVGMYAVTARALHDILPGAFFGPGEFAGGLIPGRHNKTFDYLRFAADQAKKPTLPFDYIANSAHAIPKWQGDKLVGCADPRERAAGSVKSFDNLRRTWPALENDPVYIFQFGILSVEVADPEHPAQMIDTNEPGGRGAAWTFDTILEFKQREPHLAGIWHWDVGDVIPHDRDQSAFILYGNGWLYQIFDQFRGGDAYVSPTVEVSPGRLVKALFARKEGRGYLLLSNFSPDRRRSQSQAVNLSLPASLLTGIDMKTTGQLVLSEENCPMQRIKETLRQAGLLRPPYLNTPVLANTRQMGGRPGMNFVVARLAEFEKLIVESLTLKPFAGTVKSNADGAELTSALPADSVTLVAFGDRNSSQK